MSLSELNDNVDWEALRQASLLPGGFGDERQQLWPKLLHVRDVQDGADSDDDDALSPPHADERQIQLDTDRSFVLYPAVEKDRETLQQELHELLVAVFRKRPTLSYFQGYHDIITVLFLTLPPEMQLPCAEHLSLHRLRDSMGAGLEPVLGLLRVMQNLLRLVDPSYAELLERTSPLPFHALSNLLTLFSHDMPTLPLIQHVFDYILCRPPIIVIYLATSVVLARKDEARRLEEEDEDGMIHSLLSSLPTITDEPESKEKTVDLEDQSSPVEPFDDAKRHAVKTEDFTETPMEPEIVDSDTSFRYEHVEPPTLKDEDAAVSSPEPPSSTKEEDSDASLPKKSPSDPTFSSSFIDFPVRKPTVSLVSLLSRADELFETYPPSHPSLGLSSIMGPQSVIFTWSPSRSALPDDDFAERMVEQPELTVFPALAEPAKENDEAGKVAKRRHRKLYKRPPSRRTLIATAVLVLGIAMAFYGTRNGMIPAGEMGRWRGQAGVHTHLLHREWKKMASWMKNVLVTGARILEH